MRVRTGTAASDERDGGQAPREPVGRRSAIPEAERTRIKEGIWYCLKVFLAVRIGLFVLALVAVALLPAHHAYSAAGSQPVPGPVSVPGWPAHETTPGLHNIFTA